MHHGTQNHYVMQNVVEGDVVERLWRDSKEEADLLAYRQQCRSMSMQLTEAKRDYYSTKREANNDDQKPLFDITKKLLRSNYTNP